MIPVPRDQVLGVMITVVAIVCIALMAVGVSSVVIRQDLESKRGSRYHLSVDGGDETAGIAKGSHIEAVILDHPPQ